MCLELVRFWAEEVGGRVGDGFELDRCGVEVVGGDGDRDVSVVADRDPASAGLGGVRVRSGSGVPSMVRSFSVWVAVCTAAASLTIAGGEPYSFRAGVRDLRPRSWLSCCQIARTQRAWPSAVFPNCVWSTDVVTFRRGGSVSRSALAELK
jgi:hypothetical protein